MKCQLVEENTFTQSLDQSLYRTYVERAMSAIQASELLRRLLNGGRELKCGKCHQGRYDVTWEHIRWVPNLQSSYRTRRSEPGQVIKRG